jgi:hypothetical protein
MGLPHSGQIGPSCSRSTLSHVLRRAAHQDQGHKQGFIPVRLADPVIGVCQRYGLHSIIIGKRPAQVQDKSRAVVVMSGRSHTNFLLANLMGFIQNDPTVAPLDERQAVKTTDEEIMKK